MFSFLAVCLHLYYIISYDDDRFLFATLVHFVCIIGRKRKKEVVLLLSKRSIEIEQKNKKRERECTFFSLNLTLGKRRNKKVVKKRWLWC